MPSGFRKPTKSEIITKQRDVIRNLLKIAEAQEKLIEDMRVAYSSNKE